MVFTASANCAAVIPKFEQIAQAARAFSTLPRPGKRDFDDCLIDSEAAGKGPDNKIIDMSNQHRR